MKKEIYLVLHNIRSAHNVGSIFRTADAAGVKRIFLCGTTPTPKNPSNQESGIMNQESEMFGAAAKISKVALGAEKMVPWEQHKQTWRLLEKLKKQGVQIVALEQAPQAVDYKKFSAGGGSAFGGKPLALVLGNEVGGLSKEILKYADKIIAIPMYGQKESLNVSVAAGIALYQLII